MFFRQNGQAVAHYYGNIGLWVLILILTVIAQQADLLHSLRYDRQLVAGGAGGCCSVASWCMPTGRTGH
jgi:hypothetical protein